MTTAPTPTPATAERLARALARQLSPNALVRLKETQEAEEAVGEPQNAMDLKTLIEWYEETRAALAAYTAEGGKL